MSAADRMARLRKRDLLKGSAALALFGAVPFRLGAQQPLRPIGRLNLLFSTSDDLDASLPGFMGGPAGLTPNLDALAARSHRFVNNRTVAPICMPSRQAFMSGLLPHRNGGTGFIPMNEGTPSLTTILKSQGYLTAAIHKVEHMQPASSFPWDYVQSGEDRHGWSTPWGCRSPSPRPGPRTNPSSSSATSTILIGPSAVARAA